ncbi:hypothetical protein TNCV_299121 [Trichonephila clavipes]|nr:hypothetical protein TNCV_299121 [Trichonephila clavipes]
MPSEQRQMPPKKGKALQRPLEHLKMWNEFECQFRAGGDVKWPVCSPDLYPPDYFFLAYLKSLVGKDRSKALDDLRNNIRAEIGIIPVYMLEKVFEINCINVLIMDGVM